MAIDPLLLGFWRENLNKAMAEAVDEYAASAVPAADDADEIWPRLMRLRRICFRKLDLPLAECWCLKAAPDGRDIPCDQANEPTAWDLLGKPGVAKSDGKGA